MYLYLYIIRTIYIYIYYTIERTFIYGAYKLENYTTELIGIKLYSNIP